MTKRQRTIQYRRLNREHVGEVAGSLQEIVGRALRQQRKGEVIGEKVRARIADLDQDGKNTILNTAKPIGMVGEKEVFAGELILYRQGIDMPAIEEDLQSENNYFKVRQYKAEDKNKPIEGILYFVSYDDHIGVIESTSVKTKWLERYLTWLLKDATDELDEDSIVSLDAKFAAGSGVTALPDATEVSISAQTVDRGGKGVTETARGLARGSSAGATVLEILKLLGWEQPQIDALLNDLPAGGTLQGDVRVFAKVKGKRAEFGSATLEHALRHVDPEDVVFRGKSGNQTNDLVKLTKSAPVTEVGSLLDPADAVEQIWNMLRAWAHEGRIDLAI